MSGTRYLIPLTFTVINSVILCASGFAQPAVIPAADFRDTGVVPTLDLKSQPKIVWSFSPKNVPLGALVVTDHSVFISTERNGLYGLRSSDGWINWLNLGNDLDRVSGMA